MTTSITAPRVVPLILLVVLSVSPVAGQQLPGAACGALVPLDEAVGFVPIPRGTLFCPLLADPKEPRSFATYQRGSQAPFDADIGAVGIGDQFGIARWGGRGGGDGVQLAMAAAVFAQFDLDTPSYDLINADYLIGLVGTVRRTGFSARIQLRHQSSHLGDEYLIREQPERENLSFEAVHLLLSQEVGALRVYLGGETLFNREPDDLSRTVVQSGVELRQPRALIRVGSLGSARLVAGVDLKATEEQDWSPATSVRAGIDVGRASPADGPSRRWQLMGEFYDGPTPYGQFFRDAIRYWGLGMHFSL
jgi:hypothetical protein